MSSSFLRHASRALITFFLILPLAAQQDRIQGPIYSSRGVALRGVVSPKIQRAQDLGRVDTSRKITWATLALRRTAAQQAALDRLLVDLQDPASPYFHQWLTPEEFGQRFGASASDIAQVTAWLKGQGLVIEQTARGRNWINFSGTAGNIERAFHTEVHSYDLDGVLHFGIATEPSVPPAIAPLVLTIRGLDDFRPKSFGPKPRPRTTLSDGSHALLAGDIATIYDIKPLYSQNIDGTGQTVVVVGASNVYSADIQTARSDTGLPSPKVQTVLVGADPGVTGAQAEADIDLEWLGSVAPNANILFVLADDAFVAAAQAVDQNYAPVMSMSFSFCEANASSEPAVTEAVAQQANAQGITWVVASGDQASAPCDRSGTTGEMPTIATHGISVNFPATLPEVTAVGGTMFNEGDSYWSLQNNNGASALSYMPEVSWNETIANGGTIVGSTGGVSTLYPKPTWQAAPGVPNDGKRDVPDLALDSAIYHDPYIVFLNDGQIGMYGGSSVAAPIFAGMVVLLNEYLVKHGVQTRPGLGNINPALYRLYQTTPKAFHDITVGGNIVPCENGTPSCVNGNFGYSAGPGYDLVTGLGSVDAANLITLWSAPPATGTDIATITVTASPSSLTVEGTTVVTATVRPAGGTLTPTGSVSFVAGTTTLGSQSLSSSGIGGPTATASITVYGSQLPVGSDTITAVYSGSSAFNSTSGSVTVNISVPSSAAAVIPSFTPNPVYEEQKDSQGFSWFFTVTLTNTTGVAATLTGFTFGGQDYSSSIPDFFGGSQISGYGTLQAPLGASIDSVPSTIPLGFSGTDANGNHWSQQISVPFYGAQTSASLALSSSPSVVLQNPNAPASCQYFQQLNVQEQNGFGVLLTRFTAGGNDYTSHIQDWFGALRLAPFGALASNICWTGIQPPVTLQFELDGVDVHGNDVAATGSVKFQGPASNPGELMASTDALLLGVTDSNSSPTTSSLNITVPPGQPWSLTVLPTNAKTSWLTLSPLSGVGPTQVTVTASPGGLSNGAYTAQLAIQSINTIPQFFIVEVVFGIGATPDVSIAAIANAASFTTGVAPGMLMSVFGSNLAPSKKEAGSLPLPLTMAGVSATINGVPAPLYYVSPTQLNIQVPYETPAGVQVLAVNNNGRVGLFFFQVDFSAPGIFADANGNTVPYASGSRGKTYVLFITGEGEVTPELATGASPKSGTAAKSLPKPVLPQTLTIGGVNAKIDFIGIPPGLAGVTQVNFTVPNNAPTGPQSVIITVGTQSSSTATFTVK